MKPGVGKLQSWVIVCAWQTVTKRDASNATQPSARRNRQKTIALNLGKAFMGVLIVNTTTHRGPLRAESRHL